MQLVACGVCVMQVVESGVGDASCCSVCLVVFVKQLIAVYGRQVVLSCASLLRKSSRLSLSQVVFSCVPSALLTLTS